MGIRYRPQGKIDFVYGRDQTLNQFNALEIQECYLLSNFNVSLLFKGKQIFSSKTAETAYKVTPSLTKKIFMNLHYSLEQVIITNYERNTY